LGSARIPKLVSSNPANYRRAIQLAYGDQGLIDYAADIADVETRLAGAPAAASVVVPGQTLAPAVNLKPALPKVMTPKIRTQGVVGGPQLPALSSLRK
jgi:hypothetical protein